MTYATTSDLLDKNNVSLNTESIKKLCVNKIREEMKQFLKSTLLLLFINVQIVNCDPTESVFTAFVAYTIGCTLLKIPAAYCNSEELYNSMHQGQMLSGIAALCLAAYIVAKPKKQKNAHKEHIKKPYKKVH